MKRGKWEAKKVSIVLRCGKFQNLPQGKVVTKIKNIKSVKFCLRLRICPGKICLLQLLLVWCRFSTLMVAAIVSLFLSIVQEGTYFSRICSTVSKIRSAPTSGICGGKEELMGILQQQNELRLPQKPPSSPPPTSYFHRFLLEWTLPVQNVAKYQKVAYFWKNLRVEFCSRIHFSFLGNR